MGKVLAGGLDEATIAFIQAQPVFFVATAPSSGGHVNLSPKGYDCLRVLGPERVVYRDLTGSGVETIAHLRENGRISLMWCAFDRPPGIVRFQGVGRVFVPGDEGYDELDRVVPSLPGSRAIVEVVADRVSSSCGYAVPVMEFAGERETLARWTAAKDDDALVAYRARRNRTSVDGLPGYPAPVTARHAERPPSVPSDG